MARFGVDQRDSARGRRGQVVFDRRRLAVRRVVVVADLRQFFARRFGLALPVPHTGIKSAGSQKLRMGAALGDLALVEHDDLVGGDDGREPVRDHERGAVLRDPLQRVLDFMLGVAVERRGRLVQHQDRRPLQHRARDRHALLLAAGQLQAALADLGLIALRRRLDEAVDLRQLRRLLHLGIAGVPAAVADVVADGVVEQHGVLRHHADRRAQRVLRDGLDVLPVDQDLAARHVIEPEQQPRDRRLAGAGRPDDRNRLAGRHLEAQPLQDRPVRIVGEAHVLEAHIA